jgi:hypothetical protein
VDGCAHNGRMSEDRAAGYIGLTVEDATDRAAADGLVLRVLEPGMRYTMEYREDRINVTLSGGKVVEARIG